MIRPRPRHRTANEDGIALIAAILIIVVIGIVMTVAITASTSTSREVGEQGQRSSAFLVAQEAAQGIQQALQASGDTLGDAFDVSPAVVQSAAQLTNAVPATGAAATNAYRFPASTPAALRTTWTRPADPTDPAGDQAAWQVISVRAPDITVTPPRNYASVLIRAWVQSGTATKTSLVRARYRPGTFFDYQIISDVAIAFDASTRITGNVHSNGFIEDSVYPPSNPSDRIWASGGSVGCQSYDGGTSKPIISTANGEVRNVSSSSCELRANSDEQILLSRAAATFRAMEANCGRNGVSCFRAGPATPVNASYRINLATGVVTRPAGTTATIVGATATGGRGFLFDRDVEVYGQSTGRVTVATRSTVAGVEATDVRIIGNTTAATSSRTARNSLALVAQRDVVIDTNVACTTQIRAALLASTGSVTIPREHREPISFGQTIPNCTSITITGSIASHGSVVMSWGLAGQRAGYASRNYIWDPWMAYFPPPYTPLSEPWEMTALDVADGDCLLNSAKATCA